MGECQFGDRVGGKYTLIGCAGRGGMAEVWIARNDATSGDVAIKMLRSDRRAVDQSEERFHQEARVSANLSHPNVARVFDLVEEDDGSLLLVMERLRGETLRDKLLAGPLEPAKAVSILLPILDALDAAHGAGIVHRDVNPANVFLAQDADGHITPKLIDFGVAKALDNTIETKAGQALGTPQYMSPEQIRSSVVDGRSDIFSLSVTLFEAMTGANPFKRTNASGSLASVLETEVDPDSRIPPAVWLVLSRGLAKQAYERPASALEMASGLRRAIGNSTPELQPPPATLSAPIDVAPAPKRPWGLLAAAGVLVVTIGIVAAAALRREKPADAMPATFQPPAATSIAPQSSASATSVTASSASVAPKPTARPLSLPTTKAAASGKAKAVATTPGF